MRALTKLRSACRPMQGFVGHSGGCGVHGHPFVRGSSSTEAPFVGEQIWRNGLLIGLSGMATGGAMAWAASALPQGPNSLGQGPSWLEHFALEPGLKRTVAPGQTPSSNPLLRMLMKQDHLFEAMSRVGMVKGIECFYNQEKGEFHAIVTLGRDVCGYPSTVHGGLTAAIIDETLGGLMASLWSSGVIGLLPAVTARLEVDYCKKVPQYTTVLCTARLETIDGRKMWMTAEVKDQPNGTVYATARGLFVTPRAFKFVSEWLTGVWGSKSD